jgi:MoxR-like ATPase
MQGIAQQLILDRQVGSYRVPDGWFIWAAGNRKSDRAAVFEMPSALANRFIHLDIAPDFVAQSAHVQGIQKADVESFIEQQHERRLWFRVV